MLHKITHCAGCISVKSRPHQLHWEMVTDILCRKSCLYAFTSLVPRPSTPPVFDCLQYTKNKCYIKLELAGVSHLLKNIVCLRKTHRIHNAQTKLQCAVSPYLLQLWNDNGVCVMCLHGEKPHTAWVCHSTLINDILFVSCLYGHIPCTYDSSPHLLVAPAQLMKTSTGWNASCTMDDLYNIYKST